MRVGYIACGEYARNSGPRTCTFGDDVSYFIGFNPWFEDFGVGAMTDGQEESVDSQIIVFFIGLTFTFYQMYAFNT